MGTIEPSDEDIRNWMEEGWRFARRNRRGRVFITRRMGANRERSLGRFRQSLWNRIQRISRELEEPQREKDPLYAFYGLVEVNRADLISRDCLHRDEEGYCTYWSWGSDYSLLRYREDLAMREVNEEGNTAYQFLAHGRYCRGCTAYVSEKMKALML